MPPLMALALGVLTLGASVSKSQPATPMTARITLNIAQAQGLTCSAVQSAGATASIAFVLGLAHQVTTSALTLKEACL